MQQPLAPNVVDDFQFWGLQIIEHAQFAAMGLEDQPELLAQALEIHRQLVAAYSARDLATFRAIVEQQFIPFKDAALAQLKAGTWLGWNFQSLLRHMIDEEQFFLDRTGARTMTPEQEMAFWLKERLEETELSAHLVDPTEGGAVGKLTQAANALAQLGQRCLTTCDARVVQAAQTLGLRMGAELAAMQPGRPQSVIPAELKTHVERENARFVQAATRILLTGR